MTTQCNEPSFQFEPLGSRDVVARFDGGDITSDAGGLLLRKVEQRTGIVRQFAACFQDRRKPELIEHTVKELVAQRVYGLTLGYEDLNDHDQLRADPLLAVRAGKSTLNRLERTPEKATAKEARYKKIVLDMEAADQLLVDLFLQAHASAPEQIVLDLDATDDRIHGNQEGRFYHGYSGDSCYLPRYIFCGEFLLCARLRKSDSDASAGTVDEWKRIIGQIRRVWPSVPILIRADSGFCRDEIMNWCEEQHLDYVFGLAQNDRLKAEIAIGQAAAAAAYEQLQKAARIFKDFRYRTRDSWTRDRRVVGKAEHLDKGAHPRFVVTSIAPERMDASALYEDLYCARGEMENRIKEQQLDLFADRTSTAEMRSHQIRLYFSSIAYVFMQALRRLGLKGTEMEKAQCGTIRLKLLKIGAQIRVTVRKVWIAMAQGYAYASVFAQVFTNLEEARMPSG